MYSQGDIVEVSVLDPAGKNRKARPVIILTATEDLKDSAPVVGVAISTSIPEALPPHWVCMPIKHPTVKLNQPCLAKCDWRVRFSLADINKKIGKLPAKTMLEILWRVVQLMDK